MDGCRPVCLTEKWRIGAAVRVMKTNEELMIVRHKHQVLDNGREEGRAER
jgi:hypothetical protein